MLERFTHSSTAAEDSPQAACNQGGTCKCCAAIRRARKRALFDPLPEWYSPLTPGIQLVNLSHCGDGRTLQVDLDRDWPRLFAQLALPGRGLVTTRNDAAILGRRMAYPAFSVTSSGSKGASGGSGLWIDFRRLGAARAIHMRRETGHIFGVEFADEAGYVVHRFTLTPESDMDAFFDWVRLHQACSAIRHDWVHGAGEWPEDRHNTVTRKSDMGAVVAVLAGCRDRQLALRATVAGAGVRQNAILLPQALSNDGEWWFVSDDQAGLHFHPPSLSTVEMTHPHLDPDRLSLSCLTGEHDCALLLESAEETDSTAWAQLLHALT